MSRERTGQVIPITAALSAVRVDGERLDFETISDDEQAAWRLRREAEVARERARGAKTAALERRAGALIAAGFPRRAIDEALTADETAKSIALMRSWDPDKRCIVVLSGTNGVGKTVAAAWWAMRAPIAPMFVRASTFARAPRYGSDDAVTKARWISAPALVLDELGAEFLDGIGSLKVDIDELVDTFYGDGRPLVITTNMPSAVFAERLGERVVDRIRECGVFFEDDGPSRRGAP